jgi:hypothetical protein
MLSATAYPEQRAAGLDCHALSSLLPLAGTSFLFPVKIHNLFSALHRRRAGSVVQLLHLHNLCHVVGAQERQVVAGPQFLLSFPSPCLAGVLTASWSTCTQWLPEQVQDGRFPTAWNEPNRRMSSCPSTSPC